MAGKWRCLEIVCRCLAPLAIALALDVVATGHFGVRLLPAPTARSQLRSAGSAGPTLPFRAALVAEISAGFFEVSGCAEALEKAAVLLDSASSVAAESAAAASIDGAGGGRAGFEVHLLSPTCSGASFQRDAHTHVLPSRLPPFEISEGTDNSEAASSDPQTGASYLGNDAVTDASTEDRRRAWASHGWFLGFRFLSFYAHVLSRPDIDFFVFADAMDVTVLADPFPAIAIAAARAAASGTAPPLFSQQEWRRGRHSTYMSERYAACFADRPAAMLEALADAPVLNCGVFGGPRAAVLAVLADMVQGYRRAIRLASGLSVPYEEVGVGSAPGTDARARAASCVSLGMDMALFNEAVRRRAAAPSSPLTEGGRGLRLSLITNEPLCAVFRNTCGFSYHVRGGGTRLVAVPDAAMAQNAHISCADDYPSVVPLPRNATLIEGEAWVVGFCSASPGRELPRRDVRCSGELLPFALLHKGTVVRDL